MPASHIFSVLRNCKKYFRDREGVAALEFSLVVPLLLLLMFGIVEYSLIMYTQSLMEGSTTLSSRLGKTGYTESGLSREQTIINALRAHATQLLDTSKFTITSKYYGQFDQIGDEEPYIDGNDNDRYDAGETYNDVNGNGQWDEDMAEQGYGDANDIVVYTVSYPWKISTPIIGRFFSEDGIVTLTSVAVVKNEPY